ncbi:MAG: hypothetical protein MMC33_003646 [Icmadophila ericetorum]|nr:hypothetical protein [Icmadophila ericetorum]
MGLVLPPPRRHRLLRITLETTTYRYKKLVLLCLSIACLELLRDPVQRPPLKPPTRQRSVILPPETKPPNYQLQSAAGRKILSDSSQLCGFALEQLPIGAVGVFNHSGVSLRITSVDSAPTDYRTDCYRLVLSAHLRIVPSLLYSQLDRKSYTTRERVKLRNGGVVDLDDINRGWLVSKIVVGNVPDDEDTIVVNRSDDGILRNSRTRTHWGTRGISVSADEGLEEAQPLHQKAQTSTGQNTIANSDDLNEGVGNDGQDNIENRLSPTTPEQHNSLSGVGNGEEWRNETIR